MYMSRQSAHQELNLCFIILFSGSFLSVDLTNMTSIEYKNLLTRCANAICKIYNINTILKNSLCIIHIFLYDVFFPSVLNKQLKKLLDLMEERKGSDFIFEHGL